MKKIIVGLLFNALIALNAGILSENPRHYRSLSRAEYNVFGSPDLTEREKLLGMICYLEIRQLLGRTPADDFEETDPILKEFTPDELGASTFNVCCSEDAKSLLTKIVESTGTTNSAEAQQKILKKIIYVWLLRKAIDDLNEEMDAETANNMLYFYKTYPMLIKTIECAKAKGETNNVKSYEKIDDCLDYPELIQKLLNKIKKEEGEQ